MPRKLVFVWENIGPSHVDRILACAADPVLDVTAVEFFARSTVYDWDNSGRTGLHIETLYPDGRAPRQPGLWWRLLKALRRERPDAVFMCHYSEPAVFFVTLLLKLTGVRVYTMIDSKFDDMERSVWREAIKVLLLAPYAGALAASRRSIAYMRFLGLNKRPVSDGFDRLDIARLQALPPAPGRAPLLHGERDFLVVARLIREKNLELALSAYALWLKVAKYPRRLRILGGGPLEASLKTHAADLGIADRVDFEGPAAATAVATAMRDGLALVFPSVQETYGFVVIEALAQGLPVLITPIPGAVDDLIDNGVNGWIVDQDRPVVLAEAMALLDRDEAAWRRASAAALASAERGDVRHFVVSVKTLVQAG
ncbi:MAG TPA: glycosyltransferase [Novosphingobium sp.]|nr:glycosyltransferase [Novosphingobium sp.]HQA17821.1 glycosyltransferase [Novosphingobium sp.]